jgi:hypothetical protein
MADFGSVPSLEYLGYDDLQNTGVVTRKDLIQQARTRSSQKKMLNYEGNYGQASDIAS